MERKFRGVIFPNAKGTFSHAFDEPIKVIAMQVVRGKNSTMVELEEAKE